LIPKVFTKYLWSKEDDRVAAQENKKEQVNTPCEAQLKLPKPVIEEKQPEPTC